MKNSINELKRAVGALFSPKSKENISHSAVGREIKNTATVAKHGLKTLVKGARATGRKIKRKHQVNIARRAVKKRLANQGIRQMNAHIELPSPILEEIIDVARGKTRTVRKKASDFIRRRKARKIVMKKLVDKKLHKMDIQRGRIKKEKKVYKRILRGRHQGEVVKHAG